MQEYTVKVFEDRTEWHQNGKLHRDGGLPAREFADGYKEWWVNGLLHRGGGLPAREWPNGDKEWWVNGELITQEEAIRLSRPCVGTKVIVSGVEYILQ